MIEERVFKIAFERKWKILVRARNSRRGELFWDEIMEKRQTRKRILESKRRENGVLWRRTCWLLTEATPTEQKFAIGLPAHLSLYLLAGLKKNPRTGSVHSADLDRGPWNTGDTYFLLTHNTNILPRTRGSIQLSIIELSLTFSLCIYLSAWCAVKLRKKLGISSRCHKVISPLFKRANCAFLCTEFYLVKRRKNKLFNSLFSTRNMII